MIVLGEVEAIAERLLDRSSSQIQAAVQADLGELLRAADRARRPLIDEIVGRRVKPGRDVRRFKEGELAAVGCLVDSCRTCAACHDGEEQTCSGPAIFTCNFPDSHPGALPTAAARRASSSTRPATGCSRATSSTAS